VDIRLLAIIALIVALMEILGKLARKRAAKEAEDGSRPARVDPFASVMEELEWLPMDEDQAAKPTPGVAALIAERPVPPAEVEPPVWPPPPPEVEPPVWPAPRTVEPAPPPRPAVSPRRPAVEPASPPHRAGRVVEYRDRTPRAIEVRSREARPVERRRAVPSRRVEEVPVPVVARRAAKAVASKGDGPKQRVVPDAGRSEGLGLRSVSGLRRLVVAREVLGPPLALRDEERR
jgi:hypothetical protein